MAKGIRLEPAATILDIIGVGNASRVTNIDRTQVWRWTQPKSKGGTGGFIPHDHHEPLLEFAKRKALPVTAVMFVRRVKSSSVRNVSVPRR